MKEITDDSISAAANRKKSATWKRRASIISKYIGAQTLIQLLSLVSGFLLVRMLRPQEYAFFTIAGTMQGTIGVLSESGVGSALISIGGRVWQDKFRFGQLIQTALSYRKRLLIFGTVIIAPILCWALVNNGSHPLYALALCIVVVTSANFQLTNGVLDLVLKMHTRLDLLQKAECVGAILRTFLTVIICFTVRYSLLAVLATLGSLVLQNSLFKRYAKQYIEFSVPTNDEDRVEITKAVKRVSPTTIFYCFQGQITVLIISVFGNVRNVAEIGALSRLGVMFLILNTLMSNVLLPRFARCQDKEVLSRMYWQIIGGFSLFSVVFIAITLVLPNTFLRLLGNNYLNLSRELPYAVASAVVSSVGSVIYSLNFGRAWMRHAWISVPIVLCTQIAMLPFLNLTSIKDVLLLNIIPSTLSWAPYLYEARFMLKRNPI